MKLTLNSELASMNNSKKCLYSCISIIISFSLSSCNPRSSPSPSTTITQPTPNNTSSASTSVTASKSSEAAVTQTPVALTTVNIYQIDSQCLQLVAEKSKIPLKDSLETVIKQIIDNFNSGDFQITGYRLTTHQNIATIDLRIAIDAPRQLSSLSLCEQLALLGALRKTLTSNKQWHINDVKFTQQGQEISF